MRRTEFSRILQQFPINNYCQLIIIDASILTKPGISSSSSLLSSFKLKIDPAKNELIQTHGQYHDDWFID